MTLNSLPNPLVKTTLPKLQFYGSLDSKHTKTCNGADELAFGNLGRCLGTL